MGRFFLGALIGAIVGGLLTFYIFVGVPRSAEVPGELVRPPDADAVPPGTAQIVLRQDFFNEALGAIFRDMEPPKFPLSSESANCPGVITVLPEGSGVRSGLRFENNSLTAPIAFTGTYNSPFGCLNFSGWAQANMQLRFDAANKMVYGQLNVETVNLDGVNPVLSSLITPIVQSTLNTRVNPVRILDGNQVAMALPIASTEANLSGSVTDVRAEVRDSALHMYVVYEFKGQPMQPGQPAAAP